MKIGIDGSRAFLPNRTGIEEYSYQVIKNLRDFLGKQEVDLPPMQVVLYLRKDQEVDFDLPENWRIKKINHARFWTQLGLSWELFLSPVDKLFVPAHTVPFIHPKDTIVTIHGLEYEFCPAAYSWWARFYMRLTIKKSCQWAKSIIAVSQNTKADLARLYKVEEGKVQVIYEGYDSRQAEMASENVDLEIKDKFLLFVGRIEERKNISKIIEAFESLKEEYQIPHKLVLAGKPGFGYAKIKNKIENAVYKNDILELGFISEERKWQLLKKAQVFIFPTQYEGFGIPVLEAQSTGCPVVAADNSSIPEIAQDSALLVPAEDSQAIAASIHELISNESLKDAIIAKGLHNVQRFSWNNCAKQIAEILK